MSQVLPQNFINAIAGVPGLDKEAFIDVHQNRQTVTSVRLNPLKPSPAIDDLPLHQPVSWCSQGMYLSERPSFTADPVFHGGAYYVQEASSMFLDYVIKEIYKDKEVPEHVADLCAAPGGKSTLLAAALPDSFIVSNEVIKIRVNILAENISKWGSDHVIVTNSDPRDFKKLPCFFDLMVIDAPCSGSGLFRKDADAVKEWSEANVEMCSFRQKRILSDAIVALRQGGYLVYSTCSYSRQENEDICDWIADQFGLQPVKISVHEDWGIVETISEKHHLPGYRFYPDKVKGEGFFIACFQQTNGEHQPYISHNKSISASKQTEASIEPFLKNSEEYILNDQKEIVIASLKKWEKALAAVSRALYVKKSGVAVGIIKGKDFIPHHELALSHLLAENMPLADLQKEEALKYLRRQEISVDTQHKGWVICSYKGIRLGWMKILSNRVNNYYPANWRILKP